MSGTRFILWALLALVATTLIPVAAQHLVSPSGPDMANQLHTWAVITFLVDLLAVAVVVVGFGYAVTGRAFGVAMSSWNDYSLSKMQMALWTIVILAALLTAAKLNLLGYFAAIPDQAGKVNVPGDPLGIFIPGELIAAMGIAAFSTAAAPAILSLKASQAPDPGEVSTAQQRMQSSDTGQTGPMQNSGKAVGFASPNSASWLDLVTGDEVANAGVVDLSKVQQLLITLLLVGTYIFLLVRTFAQASTDIPTLPALSDRFIELMALSHAGYLVYKATPKATQTSPAPPDASSPPGADSVPVRLSIDDAASLSGLTVTLDGTPIAIGASGFAELSLPPGVPHTLAARATRAGTTVSGTLTDSVTADDVNKPISVTLA